MRDLKKELTEAEDKEAVALKEVALIREALAVFESFPQSDELRSQLKVGFGRISLCTDIHPLHTKFTERFGASNSEAATRPHPTTQAVRKKQKRKRIGGGRGPSGNVIKSRAKGKANKANTEQKVIFSGLARLARLGPAL